MKLADIKPLAPIFILFALLIAAGTAFAVDIPSEAGQPFYFNMDGALGSIPKQFNDGTHIATLQEDGGPNNQIGFDGETDGAYGTSLTAYVRNVLIDYQIPSNTFDATVEMWVRPDSLNNPGFGAYYGGLMDAGAIIHFGIVGYGGGVPNPDQDDPLCQMANRSIGDTIQIDSVGDIANTPSIVDGEWHHLACVKDGAEMRLYVDGALVATGAVVGGNRPLWDSTNLLYQGGSRNLNQATLGAIDQFVVTYRAKTGTEILDYWNSNNGAAFGSLSHTPTTVDLGDPVSFTADFNNLSFTGTYLHFYEDVEETISNRVVYYDANGLTSPFNFNHTYSYTFSNFTPIADVSNCGGDDYKTAGGCSYFTLTDSQDVNVQSPLELDHTFIPDKTILDVGDSVSFQIDIDDDICATLGASSLTFNSGLPLAVELPIVLPFTNTGTFVHIYNNRGDNNGYVTPYLTADCGGGQFVEIGLWDRDSKPSIFVRDPTQPTWIPPTSDFTNGSGLEELSTSSGTTFVSFSANKEEADFNEQIIYSYYHEAPFTPFTTEFYPDFVNNPSEFEVISVANSTPQYHIHSYNTPGIKSPYLLVKSAAYNPLDNTTFTAVYLGGEVDQVKRSVINVQDQDLVLTTNFSLRTDRGIFGFPLESFRVNFGENSPPVVSVLEIVVNKGIYGVVWIASKLFSLIEQTSFFSMFKEVISPDHGTFKTMPATFVGLDVTESGVLPLPDTFVITRSQDQSTEDLFIFLLTIFAIGVVFISIISHSIKRND